MPNPWEQWQVELLEQNYGKMNTVELAEKIGKKKDAVNMYAKNHGISANRYWTEEETQFLIDNYGGRFTTARIAKQLNKPYRAVLSKITKLGIGNYLDNTDGLNLCEVARIVGRDRGTIIKTWVKHGLVYKRRGRYVMVKEEQLLKWMEEHTAYWDATEVDYYFFRRFDWFQDKYQEDSKKKREKRWSIVEKREAAST